MADFTLEAVGFSDSGHDQLEFRLSFNDHLDEWRVRAEIMAGEDIEFVPGMVFFADNGGYTPTTRDEVLLACLFEASSTYVNHTIEDFCADWAAEQKMETAVDAFEDARHDYGYDQEHMPY